MSASPFNSQKPRLVRPSEAPTRYLIGRPKKLEPWILGFYFKIVSESHQKWTVLSPSERADSTALARMLALSVIDRNTNIVKPNFMPSRPPSAVLRDDRRFRHSVTRPFAPWIESRINNIAQSMQDFSEALLNELWRDHEDDTFILKPSPPDAPFKKDAAQQFEIEIQKLPNEAEICNLQNDNRSRDTQIKEEYMQYRYMAHLDRKLLDKRAIAIFRNTYQIDSKERFSLDPKDPVTYYWQDLMSEVCQEYAVRQIRMEDYGKRIASDEDLRRSLDGKFRRAGSVSRQLLCPVGDN